MEKLSKLMLVVLFVGASSFGFTRHHAGTLMGAGTWKETKGTHGRWKRLLEITPQKDQIVVKDTLQVLTADGKQLFQEDSQWEVVQQKDGFFDMTMNGKKTGFGYCFAGQCHLTAESKEGGTYEETLAFHKAGIFVLGSDTNPKETVAWRGKLRKK